ncbi:MAG: tRNA preQ1(34) S-adenosylmethionine ribosyltransferase-isomerase QueA [Candidatus Buchananbacteria bacterium]|nr:tRNA preQ1(34) S-adenosylmethionine ribosyltransferase-isomerase QueA [Candidatus Buchananbacteria bacterium]
MKRPKKTLLKEFDYNLPANLIGQKPIKPRDSARLLILDKKTGRIEHKRFYDMAFYLQAGDVLVLNNSKVIPARLVGQKITGGKIEIFLLTKMSLKEGENDRDNHMSTKNIWQVLVKGKIKIGQEIFFKKNIKVKIIKKVDETSFLARFNVSDKKIFSIGQVPLPPYIKKSAKMSDYQTVYASLAGSVAAPTAGLHFTKKLISQIKKSGVTIEYITLHVGLGTFLPVKSKYIEDHKIHNELADLSKKTAENINQAKKSGHKIIAVGTTSLRTLEAFSDRLGKVKAQNKWVDIFIYPGYKFKAADSLITNFHLPKSTLLMLVSAFAGQKSIKKSYQEAIIEKYKFFSFGDAMLIK